MKNVAKLPALIVLTMGISPVASANTFWNASTSFAYNSFANAASGSFTLNPSLNLLTWNTVVSGINTQGDNTYTPMNGTAIYPDGRHIDFYDGATNWYVDFYLASPVTNAGGTIRSLYGDGGMSSNSTVACCATLISGMVSALPIPEPASIALFGIGMVGLAAIARRKLLL